MYYNLLNIRCKDCVNYGINNSSPPSVKLLAILLNGDILDYGDWSQEFIASRFTFNPEFNGILQITQTENNLSIIGSGEFQLFFNDIEIDGATSNLYIPMEDGIYTVNMGFDNCIFTSEPYEFITTSIESTNYSCIKIRNNPTSDFIFIDNATSILFWEIFKIEGKLLPSGDNVSDSRIDLRELQSGVYFLRCIEHRKATSIKIVKY